VSANQTSFEKTYGPRRFTRQMNAKLTSAEVRWAYVLYSHGWSLGELAEALWRRKAFASRDCCRQSIRQAFRREGLELRKPS
jgi:hypothetical protein